MTWSLLPESLKRVFHGEIRADDSVRLAEREISEIFRVGGISAIPENIDTGSLGEIVGACPLCGKNVIRGKNGYGCMGYKDGCGFRIGLSICKKTVPIGELRRMLATGTTQKLRGFISKNGKTFEGRLVVKDGSVVFSFD